MKGILIKLHQFLLWVGEGISGIALLLAGLLLIVGIPVVGIAVSLWIGQELSRHVGGGFWTIIITAFVLMMFLAHYVWHPHVSEKVLKALQLFSSRR